MIKCYKELVIEGDDEINTCNNNSNIKPLNHSSSDNKNKSNKKMTKQLM